jgi:CubicO group peptidase (beta-lactamase class C family)
MKNQTLIHLLAAMACLSASAASQVAAYHGATAAQHQTQWNTLRPQGYRMISLSVAGGLSGQHYTAVWVHRSGPSFSGIHNATYAEYTAWRTTQLNNGLRPYLVSASGSGSNEVYAAMWVNDGVDAQDLVRASRATFDTKCDWAWSNDYKLSCAAAFGTAASPLYSGVWVPNPEKTVWGYTIGDSSSGYQDRFDALTEGHGRPVFVTLSDFQQYLSIWQDDQVGGWAASHDMTSTTYQNTVNSQGGLGRFPLCAQAGGAGANARWAAVFVGTDTPIARVLTRTGTAVSGFSAFDTYMANHMLATDARAAGLAITKAGRLVYARGYTYAEPGYPITQPSSMFRIASCSKPLAAIAAHELDERLTTFSMATRVGVYLPLTPADARFDNITVAQTIQHASGMLRDAGAWTVANWLNPSNPTMPVTPWQTTLYAASRTLDFVPGTQSVYSNVGYTVLGQALEQAAGKTYERVLREEVGAPLGVTRLWIGGSRRADLLPGEVYYHGGKLTTGQSALHTDGRPLVGQYGGGGYGDINQIDAPGGVITSAVDFVRILAGTYDCARDNLLLTQATATSALAEPVAPLTVDRGGFAWEDLGNNVISHGKAGTLTGVASEVLWRSDGVAIAVFVNKSDAHASRTSLNNMANAVQSWPTHDLFPSYGLPAFQRVWPRLTGASVDRLPNVTASAFVLDGEVFTGVDRITFGARTITSQNSNTWADGWFRIVNDTRIELHPPQGMLPSGYQVRLHNGVFVSDPLSVTIEHTTGNVLMGPPTTSTAFSLFASRGSRPVNTVALLAYSNLLSPSSLPGVVDLGIGAGFTAFWLWPEGTTFNGLTRVASWQIPDFGAGTVHFQAILVEPGAPLPLATTNIESVRGL